VALASAERAVIQTRLETLGVVRMPTVLGVNDDGTVVTMRSGTIPPERHHTVFAFLVSGTPLESYGTIDRSETACIFSALRRRRNCAVGIESIHGIREKVMPVSEIAVRGAYELSAHPVTVVDCGTSLNPRSCSESVFILLKQGLRIIAAGMPRCANSSGIKPSFLRDSACQNEAADATRERALS